MDKQELDNLKKEVGVIIGVKRLENSHYGNPNYRLKIKGCYNNSAVTELTTVNNVNIKDIKIIGYSNAL